MIREGNYSDNSLIADDIDVIFILFCLVFVFACGAFDFDVLLLLVMAVYGNELLISANTQFLVGKPCGKK